MSVLTCQQRPKVDMEPTDCAHCLFFQPWELPQVSSPTYIVILRRRKKQEDTWQEIPTLNKIWIDTLSSPLMSMEVLSLLTLQLPIPLFSFRRALRGGQHGMKLLLHRACWVGALNTRFLLGTVLLQWVQ